MKKEYELKIGNQSFIVETGQIAKQAGGSVLVRYGETVVLSTATASKKAKDLPFFPLTVSFEEKLYAAGKIPGGFLRREGRPSETATLNSRLVDRTLRPLFADGFRNEVQVVNTVLSMDPEYAVEMAGLLGSSLALGISDIPFDGPVAGVQLGLIDGEFVINPTATQNEHSILNLTVAGTKDAINMVEAGAKEVSEDVMLDALMHAHTFIQEIVEFQEAIIADIGKEKMDVVLHTYDEATEAFVKENFEKDLRASVSTFDKLERQDKIDAIQDAALALAQETYADADDLNKILSDVKEIVSALVKDEVRRAISQDKVRPDGRSPEEIRPLNSMVDLLPRVHGSALFTRGQTQVLSVTTLGAMNEVQIIDDLSNEESKRFMHQYNFPPYSVGEVGRMGGAGRREIGHGALGEKALLQVIPSEEEFPYAIRVVSEVLESNGSSSQASICASTMSLMAAGVPITAPVAGIAMGMVMYDGEYAILSDIQGLEDAFGDMDFKVAGTPKGITAMQMDIKVEGISREILAEALEQAKIGRAHILENMMTAIDEVREDVGKYAPKMERLSIPVDKIRDVIGRGGDVINNIIEQSDNVKIDIEDDGSVVIYHSNRESINKAKAMIESIVKVAVVGEIYEAKVVRVENFGAFVELFPGTDGLLHISKIAHERTEKVSDVLNIGDIVKVKVVEIDDRNRVNVSRKDLLPKPASKPAVEKEKVEKK
ncbi:MAG: polyribonucleotide nucleotidyltransferase [Erysipelothrix sp.]|nr:polyribonucleotide nucleotidyltransferase [Erysipelothrix sp.]